MTKDWSTDEHVAALWLGEGSGWGAPVREGGVDNRPVPPLSLCIFVTLSVLALSFSLFFLLTQNYSHISFFVVQSVHSL